MGEPTFPPLLQGYGVTGAMDPFDQAQAQAALGCDAGLVVHNVQADRLRAAMVFAPEVPLDQAMVMLPACGIGFQNALGALAPPEVAVHLEWAGGIRVNGASCGFFQAASSGTDGSQAPDWLVIGLEVPFIQPSNAPGLTPDQTALYDEGCVDIDPAQLLESWARHMLVWINRWSDEGTGPLHREWMGLAHGVGEAATVGDQAGTFVGVDEHFGMLLRDDKTTHLIPLRMILKGHAP
ncbi:biotin/lipoate--protein ligase family protein [Pseudaestuariivita rosea]|uniref:biotin/lipoate--protein ligase family protein n=1 Tax=Pseudaestuariivita rosea TaxID=2763263 RepID=UPI001ABAFBFA|nr:biotin/lipoate--protein ligase family protein [Pseudaestuariivita rosea]